MVVSRPRKTRKKPRNICTWIRQRTSPYCYGIKTKAGNPAHVNKNDDIQYHFQCLKAGWHGRRLTRLRNSDMADHFAGRKTFYFTSDGRSSAPEVLVNIAIDCHKSGSLKGAVAFAGHLRDTRFSDLYIEKSTNGNGVHGYIVVVKGDLGDEGLNPLLSRLDSWLKHELSQGRWDVEAVEVKGQCPEFSWGWDKYELKTYKSGQLAKLPREAMTRADELRGTTRIGVDELRRLPVPARSESADSVVPKEEASRDGSAINEPVRRASGSISCRHFGVDELSNLKGGYLSLATDLLGETKLVAAGRKVVTEEDMAIFLMLVRFFTANMNADGSLPTARWKAMWAALHESGDIERAWCHHRFATLRNFLTKEGWLSWEDESYVSGVVGEGGRFIPGKAAKWRAGEELMARMVELEGREMGSVEEVREEEEGRTILYGCSVLNEEQDEGEVEGRSILYGRTPPSITRPTPKPGQSRSLRAVLEHVGIDIPLQRPRFAGYAWGPTRRAA